MSAVAELGDKLAGLTIAQAVELKDYLKTKYGIEPAGGGVMIAAPVGGAAGGAAEPAKAAEPTEFNVIKVVRELTGQGLAEAKATVEGAPKPIKEGIDKKAAEDLKKKLEEAGAKVDMK